MTLTPGKLILAKDYPADDDARAYVAAVEDADELDTPGIGALEPAVIAAYDNFIVGCKADGIWNAIKASCILAGARTLSGALVPLVGTAPTNNGPFVAADYDRKTGLVGDGSTKYLDSNRDNNADPQNNQHVASYCTQVNSGSTGIFLGSDGVSTPGATSVYINFAKNVFTVSRSAGSANQTGTTLQAGFIGVSRASSANYTRRFNSNNQNVIRTSSASTSSRIFVFDRGPTPPHFPLNSRLTFYSIGESLDLALLDARVSTLISDLGAAIP
jgi:hypothetical protein